jgi:hypothetical protein
VPNFTYEDIQVIKNAYRMLLVHLKNYLKQYDVKDAIPYSKILFNMIHNGFFSMNRTIKFDDNYDYLNLPIEISQGVQVMYGICCCRHATEFCYNLLCLLNFNVSLMYIWINKDTGLWRKVNPPVEKANHLAILLNDKYIIDPANKFILQIQNNGDLKLLDSEYLGDLNGYQENNINIIGKTLRKYYQYKELGIENIYS